VYTEIVDEQVPEALLMIPRTGDNLMSFVAASMISGLGLAVLTIFGKREREEA
jgi:LPXTG-motif cell wall-anchored protein